MSGLDPFLVTQNIDSGEITKIGGKVLLKQVIDVCRGGCCSWIVAIRLVVDVIGIRD